MGRPTCTEAELAAVVVAWLEALGGDVYQEVECATGVADIVAKVRGELWIVETKLAWSLALILQAMERRAEAARVYVAAPHSRTMRGCAWVCAELGIGVLDVQVASEHIDAGSGYGQPNVREVAASRKWNRRPTALAKILRPEHKTHAKAGTNGGRWTPFRSTCEQVARAVKESPGITLKELVDGIKHHYRGNRSAVSSIAHWIDKGKIEGVRVEREPGAQLKLYPTGAR